MWVVDRHSGAVEGEFSAVTSLLPTISSFRITVYLSSSTFIKR